MSQFEGAFQRLKQVASRAAANSYSPYSRFPVGAAVTGESGAVYSGCNVENASFGLTQCAERSALAAAVCDGVEPGTLNMLVIYTPGDTAHSPCGACRQVMHELMGDKSQVVSCCDGDDRQVWAPSQYLPDPFVPESLLK